MSKIKPYVLHDHLTISEIIELLERAYNEGKEDGREEGIKEVADLKADIYQEGYDKGFEHGKKEGFAEGKEEGLKIATPITITNPWITTPLKTIPDFPTTPNTPNDWPPHVVYCNTAEKGVTS